MSNWKTKTGAILGIIVGLAGGIKLAIAGDFGGAWASLITVAGFFTALGLGGKLQKIIESFKKK